MKATLTISLTSQARTECTCDLTARKAYVDTKNANIHSLKAVLVDCRSCSAIVSAVAEIAF